MKEYITQLESEIGNKVTENNELRIHNQRLVDENKRLTDLTRMLLSSPSFSDFLSHLSSNPQQLSQTQPTQQQESRQVPKDVNPYGNHQQVGMAMIPEEPLDFSMPNLDTGDTFDFQPQVYAVLETPEPTVVDTAVLSGKTSNFVGEQFDSEEEKVEMPVLEKAPALDEEEDAVVDETEAVATPVVDEEFDNDPAFALYHDSEPAVAAKEPVEIDTDAFSRVDIFGGIEPDKALARFELVGPSEDEEVSATLAMARVQRISAGLGSVMSRLDLLTADL